MASIWDQFPDYMPDRRDQPPSRMGAAPRLAEPVARVQSWDDFPDFVSPAGLGPAVEPAPLRGPAPAADAMPVVPSRRDDQPGSGATRGLTEPSRDWPRGLSPDAAIFRQQADALAEELDRLDGDERTFLEEQIADLRKKAAELDRDYKRPADPEVTPFDNEGTGALLTRRGQQVAAGAADVAASVPEALAILGADIEFAAKRRAPQQIVENLARQRWYLDLAGRESTTPEQREGIAVALESLREGYGLWLDVANRDVAEADKRPLFEVGDAIRGKVEAAVGAPDPRDTAFWGKVATGAGSAVAFIAGALTTGALGTAALGAAANASGIYREAKDAGASEEDAMAAARLGGLLGATEAVPIMRALDRLPSPVRGPVADAMARRLIDIGKDGGEEAIQEAINAIGNNMIARGYFDPDRGIAEGVGEQALIGAILGTGLGAAVTATRRYSLPSDDREDPSPLSPPTQGAPPRVPGTDTPPAVSDAARLAAAQTRRDELDAAIADAQRAGADRTQIERLRDERDAAETEIEDIESPIPTDVIDAGRRIAVTPVDPLAPEPLGMPAAAELPPVEPARPVLPDADAVEAARWLLPAGDTAAQVLDMAPEERAELVREAQEARIAPLPLDDALERLRAAMPEPEPAPLPLPEAPSEALRRQERARDAEQDGILTGAPRDVAPQDPDARPFALPEGVEVIDARDGLFRFDPRAIKTDARRFQFKSGGDAQGVTSTLAGTQRFDRKASGKIVAWQDLQGDLFIVDGHQRLGLAQRMQARGQEDVALDGYILREADGVTAEEAMYRGAILNLQALGQSTKPVDVARVFRRGGVTEAVRDVVPPGSVAFKDGLSLARLSDDAFMMVVNEQVDDGHAAEIGRVIEDGPAQVAALDYMRKNPPANRDQARIVAGQMREAGFATETQTDLFGDQTVATPLFAERARILDNAQKWLRATSKVFKTAIDSETVLAEAGNVLDSAANARSLSENQQTAIAIERLALRRGPVSDALSQQAARLARGEVKAGEARQAFLEAVRNLDAGATAPVVGRRAADVADRPADAGGQVRAAAEPVADAARPAQAEAVTPETPRADPLAPARVEPLNDRSVIVRGIGRDRKDALGGVPAVWNAKEGGWVVARKNEAAARAAVADQDTIKQPAAAQAVDAPAVSEPAPVREAPRVASDQETAGPADRNLLPDGRWQARVGDVVYQRVPGPFGTPASIRGEVYEKDGALRVRVTGAAGALTNNYSGRKTLEYSSAWTVADDPQPERVAAARQEAERRRDQEWRDAMAASRQSALAAVDRAVFEGHTRLTAENARVGLEVISHDPNNPGPQIIGEFQDGIAYFTPDADEAPRSAPMEYWTIPPGAKVVDVPGRQELEPEEAAPSAVQLPSVPQPPEPPTYESAIAKPAAARTDADNQAIVAKLSGLRSLSRGQEISLDRARQALAVDAAKWKVGQGVGYYVAGGQGRRQLNRGFRIVSVDPETKSVVVRQVADTGLTSSGGNNDRFAPMRMPMIDLKRDRNYDARQPAAPAVEPGADGLPQTVIPGAEASPAQAAQAVTDRQRAEMQARAQQSTMRRGGQTRVENDEGGLFGAPERDMFTDPRLGFAADESGGLSLPQFMQTAPKTAGRTALDRINEANARYATVTPSQMALPPTFVLPPRTGLMRFREWIQDRFLMFEAVEDALKATGAAVPDTMSFRLRQIVYPGRVATRLERLMEQELRPITDAMRKENVTLEDVGLYLMARHAPERNAEMAKRDPKAFGKGNGSGILDAAAADLIRDLTTEGKLPGLQRIAAMVDAMIAKDMNERVLAGLISPQQAQQWRAMYKHYVPLRGFAERDDGDQVGQFGRGFDIRGKEVRTALGRHSVAENPLVQAFAMRRDGIVRAEKNRAGRALLRLIQANPAPDVWEVIGKLPTRKVLDPQTGTVKSVVDFGAMREDEVMGVKIGGQVQYLRIKDPLMAEAAKNLDLSHGGIAFRVLLLVLKMSRSVTRFFARLQTSGNPAFIVPNMMTDIGEGVWSAYNVDKKRMAAAYTRNYVLALATGIQSEVRDSALGRGLSKVPIAKLQKLVGPISPAQVSGYERYLKEWEEDGGRINFMAFRDMDEITGDINRMVEAGGRSQWVKRPWMIPGDIVAAIEKFNQPAEIAARLGMYVAARENGISRERAAELALDVVGNYYKRGSATPAFAALYAFFNPAVQGIEKLVRFAARRQNWPILAGVASIGFVNALAASLLYGDDDDPEGEPLYFRIPEFERNRSIIIPIGVLHDEDEPMKPNETLRGRARLEYLSWRVPHALRPLLTVGNEAAAVMLGVRKPEEATQSVGVSVLMNNNPFGSDSMWNMAAPTALDGVVDMAFNRNFLGTPIVPDAQMWNEGLPRSSQYFERSQSALAVETAQALNRISGGDKFTPGKVDIYPGHIDYTIRYWSGGLGRFLIDATESAMDVAGGVEEGARIPPLVKAFYNRTGPLAEGDRYYDMRNETLAMANRLRAANKAMVANPQDDDAAQTFDALTKELGVTMKGTRFVWTDSIIKPFERADETIRELRQEIYRVLQDDTLSRAERAAQRKRLAERIEAEQREARAEVIRMRAANVRDIVQRARDDMTAPAETGR